MGNNGKREIAGLLLVLKVLGWLLVAVLLYYYLLPAALISVNFLFVLILPFLLGLLLAALFDPLIGFFGRRLKIPRGLSVLGTMLVVIGGILASLIWMVARGITELIRLADSFPSYAEEITLGLEYTLSQVRILYFALDLPVGWQDMLLEQLESASSVALAALNWSLGMLTAIPNIILVLFFAFISFYFFSKDRDLVGRTLMQLVPPRFAPFAIKMGGETGNAILGYLRAQLILMLITMGQTLIGLYLLGIDYALLITIFVGFLDLLPVLGPGLIFVPWIVISFFLGQIRLVMGLLILYGIISLVRQLLQPKIVGDNIGIHPLETLISLYIGYKLLGVLGIILGPILLVIFKGAWRYFKSYKGGD